MSYLCTTRPPAQCLLMLFIFVLRERRQEVNSEVFRLCHLLSKDKDFALINSTELSVDLQMFLIQRLHRHI